MDRTNSIDKASCYLTTEMFDALRNWQEIAQLRSLKEEKLKSCLRAKCIVEEGHFSSDIPQVAIMYCRCGLTKDLETLERMW